MIDKRPLEKNVEQSSRLLVKRYGGWMIKLTYIKGIPDRLVLAPGAVVFFVEFKRLGEKAGKLQGYRLKQMRKMGFTAEAIDNYEDFKKLFYSLQQKSKHL